MFHSYYFKHGKLELSLLDEEIDDETNRNHIGLEECSSEVPIKVSEEIYHTLETMGKFLTQTADSVEINEELLISQDLKQEDMNLSQRNIDSIIHVELGEVISNFQYAKELKQKIEDQIKKIRDYK